MKPTILFSHRTHLRNSSRVTTTLAGLACLLLVSRTKSFATEIPKPGQQIATSAKLVIGADKQEHTVRFLLYVPKQYKADGDALPVILFLHGAGERGTNIELVKKWGPPRIAEKKDDFPFIVVSPQCPSGQGWNAHLMVPLVDHVCRLLNADDDRVSVTGLSMGGRGTWDTLALAPQRFSAGIALCGPGQIEHAPKFVDIPIKAIVGAKDKQRVVDGMSQLVEAIKAAGGTHVELTIHPDLGHNVWSKTYSQSTLYDWLAKQKRSK